jgi:hypothetical protein
MDNGWNISVSRQIWSIKLDWSSKFGTTNIVFEACLKHQGVDFVWLLVEQLWIMKCSFWSKLVTSAV